MASIERTAYPRFKQKLTDFELEVLYQPSESELDFVYHHARGASQQLTLLLLLKCHQHLGYPPALTEIPEQVVVYLRGQLNVAQDTPVTYEAERSRYRYYQQVRSFLDVKSYSHGGQEVAEAIIRKSAYTMSDPARNEVERRSGFSDLINVAIEKLIEQRFELPAFSTLDRLVGHLRQEVHEILYQQITTTLTDEQRQFLDRMLVPQEDERITDFTRLKQVPGKPTLKQMRLWIKRMDWLNTLVEPVPLLEGIAHTKTRQFAAEAEALETTDMLDIHNTTKRHTLLICLIYHQRVQPKDQLVTMFLKRMKRTHNQGQEKLLVLQQQYRELEEHMMAAFSQVIHCAAKEQSDATLGTQVRTVLDNYGGVDALLEQYNQVSAYHNNNYLPLLWNIHRQHRAALFRLLQLLSIRSATQDTSILDAIHFVVEYQNSRKDFLPYEINLDFMSHRWQAFVQTRHLGQIVLKRRELEIAILSHLADGIRCGDLYVIGSEEYADYRQQLLPWEECQTRLLEYCQALELPDSAEGFVRQLKDSLTQLYGTPHFQDKNRSEIRWKIQLIQSPPRR